MVEEAGPGPDADARQVQSGPEAERCIHRAAIVVMLATGSVMQWFGTSRLVAYRATFVHDVFAFAVFIVVIGHVAFALTHRDAMRSMIKAGSPRAGRLGTRRRGWRSNEGRSPRRWIATPTPAPEPMIATSGGSAASRRGRADCSIECRLSRGGRVLSVAVCGRNERNRRELRPPVGGRTARPLLLALAASPSGAAWLRGSPRCTLGPDGRRDDIDGQRYPSRLPARGE